MGWIEDRTGARQWFRSVRARLSRPLPLKSAGITLGSVALFLLFLQFVSGALLTVYYVPSWSDAHDSVAHIVTEVRFGWLVRSVHVWSAHMTVAIVALHLMRVFVRGAYARPREATWWCGVLLGSLVAGAAFTGQALPMDEEATGGMAVAASFADSVGAGALVRGGPYVGQATLSRMFAAHVVFIPGSLLLLITLHLALVGRHRLQGAETMEGSSSAFPRRAALSCSGALAVLAVLAVAWPAGLGSEADPLGTAEHVKPMWIFLPIYQAVKGIPAWAAPLLLAIPAGFLILVPFLPWRRPVLAAGAVLLAAAVALGVLGAMA
ncbi:MAG: cytochrome b N-terminal domain-containing protein [Planctomycetes bacterium]|nr:cytochrome b N-terminal domain-containing protein [Planctomycetota bacterium]